MKTSIAFLCFEFLCIDFRLQTGFGREAVPVSVDRGVQQMGIPVERIIVCFICNGSPVIIIQADVVCLRPVSFILDTSDISGFEIPFIGKQLTESSRKIIIMLVLIVDLVFQS